MPLSWNEIRSRALAFSNEWSTESSEGAEAKSFWDGFFYVFGVSRRRVASFERRVEKIDGKDGYIDLLWKGTLLVEHKSRGKNLDHAYDQALDYFPGLKEHDLPRYVLVSDFARFRLYNLDTESGEEDRHDFLLEDLHKNINLFDFIAGYQAHKLKEQDPVDIEAAELMGELHDSMLEVGYAGHDLEVYLVRLLFCLFAEDTGIFERQQFQEYIENRTSEDGTDLGACLDTFFDVLNTPLAERLENRDEQLNAFPFVNGKLFEERLRPASFDRAMRGFLLQCCELDWGCISPAIFGSLFQSIMDKEARRNLGAHYTSEKNILKLINPLFMDDLRAEFDKIKTNRKKLSEFHNKLHGLKFLDPACGCGNFLVIAYRELRLLELEILKMTYKKQSTKHLDIEMMVRLNVNQFYGIEIEEFPAQIAQVAMWLVDHQMNTLVSQELGRYFSRIPLESSANIRHGNALKIDWQKIIAKNELNFIIGNPPFIGRQFQSANQKSEMLSCYHQSKTVGIMDYVSAWYCKAVDYIFNSDIGVAFVSTNSITQGEQVAPLWRELRSRSEVHISFAHRTFKWMNEAKGRAAVYCVIIGFGVNEIKTKRLFGYESVDAEPYEIKAKYINAYLIDAPDCFVGSRRNPICSIKSMDYGSMPNDGGNLLLSESEKILLVRQEPEARKWIKDFFNAEEFLHNKRRYCLWLVDCLPNQLRQMPLVRKRVAAVRKHRKGSKRAATQKLASTPAIFGEIRYSKNKYLLIPRVTSENRLYIPIGYMSPKCICGDACLQIPNASLYDFGIITSLMHMAWMRTVCGRLESRYRYSINIVYNNFPWPEAPTQRQIADIEAKAQSVLDSREEDPNATLADLYDSLTMPATLRKAHRVLDRAIDRVYRKAAFKTEAERVSYLFDLHQKYVDLAP